MNIPYVMKKCNKCGRWLVASTVNFHREKAGKYGIRATCKECKNSQNKQYNKNHREEQSKRWQEYRKSEHGKQVIAAKKFNERNRRRLWKQNQGKGITSEQYKEVMSFFDWKCAYSGEKLKKDTRTLDHIIPLKQGGDHEIWNLVPMARSLNCSKQEKDMLEWYKEQDCYSEARLAKIYEWQEYARKKWEN